MSKAPWAGRLVALGAFALLSLAASAAHAVYQCGPDKDDCKCGMDDPYPCCSNGGNCTWWAWEQACCKWVVGLPGWGNANQWAGNAKANPKYDVLSSPVVGSIANRVSGSYGHVAWVTAVNGSQITVTEQNCWGGWGHQTSTYSASWFDGGFIVPHEDCECQAGQTQTETCGNCGERKRSCSSTCKWQSWGECGGQGTCVPGTSEDPACGDCGHQTRSCQSDCSWGAPSACQGADPGGGDVECDTGKQGVCAKGVKKCVEGTTECVASTSPSKEICDGLDNDCNGADDDSTDCWEKSSIDAGTAPQAAAAGRGTKTPGAASQESGDMSGGVGCSVSERKAPLDRDAALLAFAACLGLATRRRRPRPSQPTAT